MLPAVLACLDGTVCAPDDARIPVTDEGLQRGDGVFEALRLYEGRPYALEEHLERLARSAAELRLPLDVQAVRADAAKLLAAAAGSPGHDGLRIFVTRGGHRILLTETWGAREAPPARLATITYAPTRLLDGVKSLSYAANVLATRLAQERGCDEALLVTPHGRVLEGPTFSFFWAADGALYTPPLSDRILASITRGRVLEITSAEERSCPLDELLAADEVFLASTLREVQPVSAIDERELPADGPVTRETARLLRARISADLAAEPA